MKILSESTKGISVYDMADGEIAVIVDWPSRENINTVVQRWGTHLIALGKDPDHSWPNFFGGCRSCAGKVRILHAGSKLEV